MDEQLTNLLKRTVRAESMNVNDAITALQAPGYQLFDGFHKRLNRSGSLYIEPKVSDFVIEKSEKHQKASSTLYLKDRGLLRYMILSGDIMSAKTLIKEKFSQLYE